MELTLARKELLVARIISGKTRLRLLGEDGHFVVVVVGHPTREQRYISEEIYQEAFQEAALTDSFTGEQMNAFMREHKLWTPEMEQELTQLEKDIEELKTKLVGLVFRSVERNAGKKALAAAKKRQRELQTRLHSYDHLTCEGAAGLARARHSLLCSIEGQVSDHVFGNALEEYAASRLDDGTLREIARTDPWRSIWSGRKASSSVFGVDAVDLTEEQHRLQVWSQLYENIAQHPDCPCDEIIADDDLCDGWLILQRRKHEAQQNEARADAVLGNEKIRNSQEIFVVADNEADAKRINALNTADATMTKRQREKQIDVQGVVEEHKLADNQMEIRMQQTRLQAETLRGK